MDELLQDAVRAHETLFRWQRPSDPYVRRCAEWLAKHAPGTLRDLLELLAEDNPATHERAVGVLARIRNTHGGTVAPDGTTECIRVPGITEVRVLATVLPDGTPLYEQGCECCQGSGSVRCGGPEYPDLEQTPCPECDATGCAGRGADNG